MTKIEKGLYRINGDWIAWDTGWSGWNRWKVGRCLSPMDEKPDPTFMLKDSVAYYPSLRKCRNHVAMADRSAVAERRRMFPPIRTTA